MQIITTSDAVTGLQKITDILYQQVDLQTVLFLSGGKTPKELYHNLAVQKNIHPGAVAMVDERTGYKFHPNSNEAMIRDIGLLEYLKKQNIPFYPILQNDLTIEEIVRSYEKIVSSLFSKFTKKIALLGIGLDGHTAGLPVQNAKFKVQSSTLFTTDQLVVSHDEEIGEVKGRISMTFKALEQMDLLLVAAFGEEKKVALQKIFTSGLESEVPSRFFNRFDITNKTLLITDQKV